MKKVLILEDEVNIRSFVVINLKRAGYDAIEAATGQEALDAIAEYLLEKETITGKEFMKIFNRVKGIEEPEEEQKAEEAESVEEASETADAEETQEAPEATEEAQEAVETTEEVQETVETVEE